MYSMNLENNTLVTRLVPIINSTLSISCWSAFILYPCLYISSGAFGVVHRCVEKSTGRNFVAKFINTPYPADKNIVRNEINVMNQLHHPKLLNLYDAFEDKHEMALVLE